MGEIDIFPKNKYQDSLERSFLSKIQGHINYFGFFLAFPGIIVLGNTITFYIFILILLKLGKLKRVWKNKFRWKWIFISFLITSVVSLILQPPLERHPGYLNDIQLFIQYLYWIILALFAILYFRYIDLIKFSKYVVVGVAFSIIGYYFLPFKFDFGFIVIYSKLSRNAFAFQLLCLVPICFYFLYSKWNKKGIWIGIIFFLISMLSTNARSGSVILIIEIALIMLLFFKTYRLIFKTLVLFLIPFSLLLNTSAIDSIMNELADAIEPMNPRFALLLRAEEETEGDLSFDRSWLERKLMVDKGIEIALKYPFFGIGTGHFLYYDAELLSYNDYIRLQTLDKTYYNQRASHNSYIMILAEMGFIGLCLLLLIHFVPIAKTFQLFFFKDQIALKFLPLISLVGISIHYYTISSITGSINWFVIGLAWGSFIEFKKN